MNGIRPKQEKKRFFLFYYYRAGHTAKHNKGRGDENFLHH